ncbi:hypothetical protein GDO81_000544 [Engystomops pustulosus]|uniref:Uncharacterized protein n=1 Tax=Engystomops pustulosus TaxID=76066 RepID=A0AAV7D542_ENGPU|nr:hypothetical protein GDO81_000544 [Engystomops pustulosus]
MGMSSVWGLCGMCQCRDHYLFFQFKQATTIRNYALYHLYYIECHLFCHLPMRSYIRRPHNPRASTENPRACLGYHSSESRTGFEQTKDHPPALQGTS